jgi:hypothetical protein
VALSNDFLSGTSSVSIISDRTDNVAFSTIAKDSANRFFAVRLTAPRGTSMRRCVADSGFFLLWRPGFRATPASAGTAGSWRLARSSTATAKTGAAAIPRRRIARDPIRVRRASCLRCGKQGIEAVVVVVEPSPPHARPPITLPTPGQESHLIGTIIPVRVVARGTRQAW